MGPPTRAPELPDALDLNALAVEAYDKHYAQQRAEELAEVLGLVREIEPRVIVEIGCGDGGTLWAWRQIAPDAEVIGITLETGVPGRWDPSGASVIVADSHDVHTFHRLREWLGDRPIDVLFIDGDHSYNGAAADYTMYGPLVRSGGLIMFHDVALTWHPAGGEVHELWAELERGNPSARTVHSDRPRSQGFGILTQGDSQCL